MRLNFAGVADKDIREGIRRIGKVLSKQVGLFGTLTGSRPGEREDEQDRSGEPARSGADATSVGGDEQGDLARVVELPRPGESGRGRSAGGRKDR